MTLDRETMDDPLERFTAKDEANLRAFAKNADWVIDHDDLIEPYVGTYIAVLDERIVAVSDDWESLRRVMGDRQDVYIRFVEPRGRARMWRVGFASASV